MFLPACFFFIWLVRCGHTLAFHLFIGDYHGILVPMVCATWVESGTRRIMGWLGCKNGSYDPHTGRLYPQHSSGTCSSETRGAATHCHHEHADKYIAKFIFIEFTVAKPTTIDATMAIGHPSSYSRGTAPSSEAMSAWHGRSIQIYIHCSGHARIQRLSWSKRHSMAMSSKFGQQKQHAMERAWQPLQEVSRPAHPKVWEKDPDSAICVHKLWSLHWWNFST